jgi:glycosyltransferase involved in cell wall biosynthesis
LVEKKKKILKDTSFICTVYNEEDSILRFLESLKAQTVLPGEIIIVDGGSKDRTFSIMENFFDNWAREKGSCIKLQIGKKPGNSPENGLLVKLIKEEGASISMGRNTAIREASGIFISVSDAGCVLDQNWLEEINTGLDEDPGIVNGGMNYSICRSMLEKLLALSIMPGLNEVKRESFMPSSRNVSFRKTGWEKCKGYPEDLDFGEDMKFDFRLKRQGYDLKFCSGAVVYWRMREDLIGIFKQFFRYAKGDALGRMYPLRHMIRFLSGALFIAIVLAGILLSPWILFVLVLPAGVYCYRPYYRLFVRWEGNEKCRPYGVKKLPALLLIPLLLIYIDTAKVFGYLYGLLKR